MAEFTQVPNFVIEEEPIFDTLTSQGTIGLEQRRSIRDEPLRRWRLRFLARTQSELDTVRNFFVTKKASFEHFTWENIIDGLVYYVRFEKNSLIFKYKAYDKYDFECVFRQVFYWTTTTSTSSTSTSSTSTTSSSSTSTSTTSTSSTSTSTTTTSTSTTSTSTTSTTSTSSTSTTTTL